MSDGPEPEPYMLANSPSHLLHRAEQLAAERFAQLMGESVNLRQFAVIAAIHESPGLSQSDLVRITGVDRSTLADMLNRMEKREWITRQTSRLDARAYSVRLAAQGVSILRAGTQHARAADAAILDLLPRAKSRSFVNTLIKLSRLAEAAAERAERAARREAKKQAREKKKQRARAEKDARPDGGKDGKDGKDGKARGKKDGGRRRG